MKQWTTGEVAKQRNISVRTLRYYDQIDLLTPSFKDDHGKRYYSEEDLLRLQKIMILKSLSLSLEDIREILEKYTYKQILISHYNYLQEQLAQLQTNISHTTSLINMIGANESLSWEHVSKLVDQSQKDLSKKWIDYFAEDDKQFIEQTMPNLSNNDEITQQYMSLVHRIESCIAQNIPPESDEGAEIANTLLEVSTTHFEGNTELLDKIWEIRKLPTEQTGLFPLSGEVLEFVERAIVYVGR